MPTAPLPVLTPPSSGDPPDAPAAVLEATAEAAAPDAPLDVVSVNGEATNYRLSGITNTALNGLLFRGARNFTQSFGRAPSGAPWWTRTGSPNVPTSGYWVALYQLNMLATATATLAEIFPPAGFTAGTLAALNTARDGDGQTADYGDALRVGNTSYVLTDISGTAKWLSFENDTDRGATSIAAGSLLIVEPSAYREDIGWGSGLAAAWAAAGATCTWKLQQTLNGSAIFQGVWTGTGTSPATATWNTSGFQPGTVGLTLSAAPSPPLPPAPVLS